MTPLHAAVELAAVTAGLAALRLPRTPAYRSLPLAVLLFATVGVDVAREVLAVVVLRPERARLLALVGGDAWVRPAFVGAVRAAYHLEQAGYLAGPAAVVAVTVLVCAPRARRRLLCLVMGVGWATSATLAAALYPAVSGLAWTPWPIAPYYRAWHVLAALAAGACWWWGVHRLPRPRRLSPAFRAVAVLATAELLVAGSGPYAWSGSDGVWPGARWELARWIYLAAHLATAIVFLRREYLHDD